MRRRKRKHFIGICDDNYKRIQFLAVQYDIYKTEMLEYLLELAFYELETLRRSEVQHDVDLRFKNKYIMSADELFEYWKNL